LEKDNVVEFGGMSYWREYLRGTVEERILPTPWTDLTRAELESLTRMAYLRFYVRPRYIWKMITRLESPGELMRYVRVFFQLLLRPIRPQRGKKLPLPFKIGRCSLAFIEGIIATINKGVRHPVSAYGGGIKGAWALAKHEWMRSTTLEDLPSPGNAEEVILNAESRAKKALDSQLGCADRYITQSSGALGVHHKASVSLLLEDKNDAEEANKT
jgi:hypothetical protein